MTDLDTAIRAVLDADAERAPSAAAEWVAPNYPIAGSVQQPRRGLLVVAAAAAAVGVLVAAMVAYQRDDSDTAPTTRWQPDGVEVPLRDYGEPDRIMYPTVAGLARSIGIDGMAPIVVQIALSYRPWGSAEVERCVSTGDAEGCSPLASPAPGWLRPSTPRDGDVWIWMNVPDGTAIVSFRDGTRDYWQRPLDGVAVFPLIEGRDEFAIAHAEDGAELARANMRLLNAGAYPPWPGKESTSNTEHNPELTLLTFTTLEACLTQAGATWTAGRGIAHLPAGVDEATAWATCVDKTQQTIAQRVQELGLLDTGPPTTK